MNDDPLAKIRRLCLVLPETNERLSHGEPTFFVRDKKVFVNFADHRYGEGLAIWCAAPDGAQEMLLQNRPERFFVPPYVGHRGWIGVRLSDPVDWDEISDLILAAYKTVAPKTLVRQLEEAEAG